MNRRQLLIGAGATGALTGVAPGFWRAALSAPAQPGESPYGPLKGPDANGLMLPEGFTSRVVASSLAPVAGTSYLWHLFPDGGACVPTDDGGWIYVSNSENPPPIDVPDVTGLLAQVFEGLGQPLADVPLTGGVSAIRFDAEGNVVDAYRILSGTMSNCAGGLTPWGTWLSCEEWESDGEVGYDAGRVWECDPFGVAPPVVRPSLGRFKHEMAAVDPERQVVYLSEDQSDGLLYRYTPPPGTWGSGAALEGGALEAMAVADDHTVSWIPVEPHVDPAAPDRPIRTAVPGATAFDGGEGLLYDDGCLYLTTKGDDRVWVHDVAAGTMTVLYDSSEHIDPVLSGVDNIAVSAAHDLYVAEDGGNLEVCVISPDRVVYPVVRMTGGQHGFEQPTPLPLVSEVTGLALSPDGNRLYFCSQRGMGLAGLPVGPGPGILYEVTGPFRGGTLAAGVAGPGPSDPSAPSDPSDPSDPGVPSGPPPTEPLEEPAPPATEPLLVGATGTLPATGTGTRTVTAAVAGAAGAALLALRRRVSGEDPASR